MDHHEVAVLRIEQHCISARWFMHERPAARSWPAQSRSVTVRSETVQPALAVFRIALTEGCASRGDDECGAQRRTARPRFVQPEHSPGARTCRSTLPREAAGTPVSECARRRFCAADGQWDGGDD